MNKRFGFALMGILACAMCPAQDTRFARLKYQNPGAIVDLGGALWAQPLPMNFDGDNGLVAATADVPCHSVYFFENTSGKAAFPVVKPAKRIATGPRNP